MTTITPQIDSHSQATGPTSFMTERNTRALHCGYCARLGYVSEETYRFVREAIEAGLDNPFRCELCAHNYYQPGLLSAREKEIRRNAALTRPVTHQAVSPTRSSTDAKRGSERRLSQ